MGCSKRSPAEEFASDTKGGVISSEVTADQLGAGSCPLAGFGDALRLQSTGGLVFGLGAGADSAGGKFATSDLNLSREVVGRPAGGELRIPGPMEVPAPPAGAGADVGSVVQL